MFIVFEPEFAVQPFGITCDHKDEAVLHTNFGYGFPSECWKGVAFSAVIGVVIHPTSDATTVILLVMVGVPSVNAAFQKPRNLKRGATIMDASEAGIGIDL